jgi:putative ABC transport system ATP-binding protein
MKTYQLLIGLIKPESGYFSVAIIYGIAISVLTLSVPIAVQTLINTIANIGSIRAVIILSGLLMVTLIFSGILSAIRMRVMEYYERRVYSRLTAQISLKTMMAKHSFFEGKKNTAITHRYFDIMTLQKNVPILMVDGFALFLQLLVGFSLVSFYHPMLFVFNTLILFFMYLIWAYFGNSAKRTAIELSYAKYDTAEWLASTAAAHEFFKSARHLDFAGERTEALIAKYIDSHAHHFKYTFSQAIFFLVLYAVASAALLGIGGVLVVNNELSIGQLVAAELIMASVLFGVSRFTEYLKLYYELYGAADKIGNIFRIPQENLSDAHYDCAENASLVCKGLVLNHLDQTCKLDLAINAGESFFVTNDCDAIQKQLIHLLKSYEKVEQGKITLADIELSDYDVFELRQMIMTIDRSLIVNCTIKEYFRMSSPEASQTEINKVLELVGLDEVINGLPDGIDSQMSPLGNPLQPLEVLRLKLAVALVAKPSVLILNQHFDAIAPDMRVQLLKVMKQQSFIVLYFTNQVIDDVFDGTINLCTNKRTEQEGAN